VVVPLPTLRLPQSFGSRHLEKPCAKHLARSYAAPVALLRHTAAQCTLQGPALYENREPLLTIGAPRPPPLVAQGHQTDKHVQQKIQVFCAPVYECVAHQYTSASSEVGPTLWPVPHKMKAEVEPPKLE